VRRSTRRSKQPSAYALLSFSLCVRYILLQCTFDFRNQPIDHGLNVPH